MITIVVVTITSPKTILHFSACFVVCSMQKSLAGARRQLSKETAATSALIKNIITSKKVIKKGRKVGSRDKYLN